MTKPVFYGSPNSNFTYVIHDLHKKLFKLYDKIYDKLKELGLLTEENSILLRSLINTYNGTSFGKRKIKDVYNTFISFVTYKNDINDSALDLNEAAQIYCKQIYDRIKQLQSINKILINVDIDINEKLEGIKSVLQNHPQ
jgi:hypothetical protein